MLQPPLPLTDPVLRRRIAFAIALILLVSAGLRLYQLATPSQYIFDEIYYAKDAKTIIDGRLKPRPPYLWEAGDEVSWPHPEMGKFAIAAGIILFGNRAFGWRIPAVIAGMVTLACVYPLARRLGLSPSWSVIALLFAAADPLGIAQSRIATLDIFVAVWTLLCILFALRYVQDGRRRRWLWLCGLAGGLATATKWSGAMALLVCGVILIIAWWRDREPRRRAVRAIAAGEEVAAPTTGDTATPAAEPRDVASAGSRRFAFGTLKAPTIAVLLALAALVLLPAAVFMASYTQYFAVGHTFSDWVELERQAWYFNWHLNAHHTYASIPASWIIDYRPVWYYFQGGTTYRGIIAIGNPFLWWLATLCLFAAPVLALLKRTTLLLPAALMVAVLYLPWLATSRTSFLYYMTPVAPFLAILAAAGLVAFAGTVSLPRYGELVLAAVALVTAVLWNPIGRLCAWLFWEMPRRIGPAFGLVGLSIGLFLALLLVITLTAPRLHSRRPFFALALAGMVIGIVVAFLPIVLNIPISPRTSPTSCGSATGSSVVSGAPAAPHSLDRLRCLAAAATAYTARAGCAYGAPRLARSVSRAGSSGDDRRHDRLLRMQAVLGLIEDHRVRRVQHLLGDLLAPVGRQAVHDLHLRPGVPDQVDVHLVGLERGEALVVLSLPAHAGEGVGVDHVGALGGRPEVAGELDGGAGGTRCGLGAGDDRRVGAVRLGGADHHAHAGLGAHLGERVSHVVAVAGVDELDALEPAAVLADGERVGHALAGVMSIGKAVDHRHLPVLGEVVNVLLGEGADHDAVYVAAHHVGRVFDRLAHSQLDVVGAQEHGLGAELLDADLEAHPGARAGLHEDHRHGPPGEHGVRLTPFLQGLDLCGEVEQPLHGGRRQVVDGEEAAAAEAQLGDTGADRLRCHCGPLSVVMTMPSFSAAAGGAGGRRRSAARRPGRPRRCLVRRGRDAASVRRDAIR